MLPVNSEGVARGAHWFFSPSATAAAKIVATSTPGVSVGAASSNPPASSYTPPAAAKIVATSTPGASVGAASSNPPASSYTPPAAARPAPTASRIYTAPGAPAPIVRRNPATATPIVAAGPIDIDTDPSEDDVNVHAPVSMSGLGWACFL